MFRFRITCADCRSDDFDKTAGCPATGCDGDCIECFRILDGCTCCKDLGFEMCPTFDTITNCACSDGTVETHNVLTGCWAGFVISDELKASLLAIVAAECPDDDPHFTLELYGSNYSFEAHATTTDLNCPKDILGWNLLDVAALVPDFQGAAITRDEEGKCNGGAFFLSVADLGIITKAAPGGAPDGSVSCSQEGGSVAFMMRIRTPCSTLLALCPFTGIAGADFECQFLRECEDWDELLPTILPGSCEIDFSFDHVAGECPITETITFGSDAPIVLDFLSGGSPQNFTKSVPGCTGDGTTAYVVRVQKVWPATGCVHNCAASNSDVSTTYFI